MEKLWPIRCIWLRYFDVYRKNWFYAFITTFLDPIFYLISFGYGLGGVIGELKYGDVTLSYRQFIFAGVVGQSILFQGFFEAAYGGFIRMYYQKIFKAMATTPITLSEVLWGELLWDASKAVFASAAVLLIGVLTGDFDLRGALLCLPLSFVGGLLFAGLGLWAAGLSKTIEQISYPQYLVIFPMFLFCGVFFPIQNLPVPLQIFASFLPLTALLSVIRSFTLNLPVQTAPFFVIAVWTVFFTWVSRRTMTNRLIK
jgi:lipooligosaccharide transport system permease protein